MSVIAIDHLPSLFPREASEAFSKDLLPYLVQLKESTKSRIWKDVEQLFASKVKESNDKS